jgi:hypothetical protein
MYQHQQNECKFIMFLSQKATLVQRNLRVKRFFAGDFTLNRSPRCLSAQGGFVPFCKDLGAEELHPRPTFLRLALFIAL